MPEQNHLLPGSEAPGSLVGPQTGMRLSLISNLLLKQVVNLRQLPSDDGLHASSAKFGLRRSQGLAAMFAGRSIHQQPMMINSVGICLRVAGHALVVVEHHREIA